MSDPNMTKFYKRAARLETQRAKGLGFEAPGALGRSYYYRPPRSRRSFWWPVLFLLAMAFVMKATIFFVTGPDLYNSRVADLRAAPGLAEQVGGYVMQPDPVTLWLAREIGFGVRKISS